MRIVAPTVDLLYHALLFDLLSHGEAVSPRGMETLEYRNANLVLLDARDNVLASPARSPNYRFMVAEWLWIMFGMDTLEPLTRYNSKMAAFSDDGKTLAGAYGPPIAKQLAYILDTLTEDPSSRQAVLTIWKPNPAPSKDIPCTISAQFLRRNNTLHSIWTMRSSDAWLGIPYDVFVFSQLTNYIAGCLGVNIGSVALNLGSSHLYERDWAAARTLVTTVIDESVRSPRLTWRVPGSLGLRLLGVEGDQEKVEEEDLCWRRYAEVLDSPTSAAALEVLRAEST